MKRILALFLCLLVPTIAFASSSNGYRVVYDGGSLSNVKTGDPLNLKLGNKDIHFSYVRGGKEVIASPPLLSPKSATDRMSTAASAPPSVSPSSASE